jgi:quercetin dioxygenase-like cupin family protein
MLRTDEDIPYIEKPWGYERIWAETDQYVAKYFYIRAGQRLSRKYYESKEHTLYVLTGPLILELGPDDDDDDVLKLGVLDGESYHIIPGSVYRIAATSGAYAEVIEVATAPGSAIRLEDDYGRIPNISA